jgi:hypothetical protein
MIDQFKKSRFGQLVLTFFIAASLASGVVVWLYESIRIPTLNGQVSFRDDKIKDLESEVQRITDAKKEASQELELEKIQCANLKNNLAQSTNEFTALADKLKQLQEDNTKLSAYKMTPAQTNYSKDEYNHAVPSDRLRRIADQSQISLLQIDSSLTELRLESYAMYNRELQQFRESAQSQVQVSTQIPLAQISDQISGIITKTAQLIHSYYGFRISIENLRAHSYKNIFHHYQTLLSQPSQDGNSQLSDLPQPEIVQIVLDMTRNLKTNQIVTNWNSQSAKVIDDFLVKETAKKSNP